MARERWILDPEYSAVTFSIPHVPGTVRGRFGEWSGALEVEDERYTDAQVRFAVDPASVETGDEEQNREAQSEEFFDAEHFPSITFESTDIVSMDDDGFQIVGILTVHGISRPVRAVAKYIGRAPDLVGRERIGWEATLRIKRSDFQLLWHPALEGAAGVVIGDEVEVNSDVEVVRGA